MKSDSGENPATTQKNGLIEGINYAGSMPNPKTLGCTACGVSLCMIPCISKYHTLKHV